MNLLPSYAVATTRDVEWLVSVRDLREATLAHRYGVDIIDLKEPSLGPLAPVSKQVWNQLAQWYETLPQSVRLSAALGELGHALETVDCLPAAFEFAKAGPAGVGDLQQLKNHWAKLRRRLHPSIELVAVAYADSEAAGSPPAEQILDAASEAGFSRILLDTFQKNGVSSIQLLGGERLRAFGEQARSKGVWWSLAGGIRFADLGRIEEDPHGRSHSPDCVAIRGDACDTSREGNLSDERLAIWRDGLER